MELLILSAHVSIATTEALLPSSSLCFEILRTSEKLGSWIVMCMHLANHNTVVS